MEKALRDEIRGTVEKARDILREDLEERLQGVFGIHRSGTIEDTEHLPALSDPSLAETRRLLELLLPPPPRTAWEQECFEREFDKTARKLAFTHINRFVAFKLMEHTSRKLIKTAIGGGDRPRGFLFYLAENPEKEELWQAGDFDTPYRAFLLWQCAQLDKEIGVLFDPHDLATQVFPSPRAISQLRDLLNREDLEPIWADEETLGWVYQYYTPKEVREDVRTESKAAPRNSYEMAIRNQFYTPDYIVKFLVENTLGRLWLEMNPGSKITGKCPWLVTSLGQGFPEREQRDPRSLRILDPACGSGHFLLYCFDVLLTIYEEAYELPALAPALKADYPNKKDYLSDVPRLIVENNLFGIDIDKRAAQIAALALFLKAKSQNPEIKIERSNIVCAEPMPGDQALFEDFKARKLQAERGVLARILDRFWQHLEYAGEAGTLLRADIELGATIRKEYQEWSNSLPKDGDQLLLFGEKIKQLELDFSDVTGREFWRQAESTIERLLREYITESTGAEASRRSLFAKDGLEGLRFLTTLRQRFDVILMNPPFGDPTERTSDYIKEKYPNSYANIACTFVDRAVQMTPDGFIGVLSTEAGFFRKTLKDWRKKVLLEQTTMDLMCQLGGHVLDTATVRTAAYVLRTPRSPRQESRFLRVLGKSERVQRLRTLIRQLNDGVAATDFYTIDQKEFDKLPYSVFGYWCSPEVRNAFVKFPFLKPDTATVRQGLATAADFRFLRLRWEAPLGKIGQRRKWVPFAKGGEYSPYHDDVYLVVNWCNAGEEIVVWGRGRPQNTEHYFRAGLTYPRRTNKRFAPRALAGGCAFGDKGPAVETEADTDVARFALLGVFNTKLFSYLMSLTLGTAEAEGGAGANSYEVGLVNRLPIPVSVSTDEQLAELARKLVDIRRAPDMQSETTILFELPFAMSGTPTLEDALKQELEARTKAASDYIELVEQIEVKTAEHFTFGSDAQAEVRQYVPEMFEIKVPKRKFLKRELARRLMSYAVGCVFGRWDIRYATGKREFERLPGPFETQPAQAPGALVGLPPGDYPLSIKRDGLLCSERGHEDDVVGRVQDVLGLIWGSKADAIEDEVCRTLGVKQLRDYFEKFGKGGFWDDHFKDYSKKPRRGPLYWPLTSPQGGYVVWAYFHSLNDDTLFRILSNRYLGSKITGLRQKMDELRGSYSENLDKSGEAKLSKLEAELTELESFGRNIRSAAERKNEHGTQVGFRPFLDDGVVLTAAPLHELIPWPDKGKISGKPVNRLEVYWEELQTGKHDWSLTALHYWPGRVRKAYETDPSIEISHRELLSFESCN